jgi:hypothetical protein
MAGKGRWAVGVLAGVLGGLFGVQPASAREAGTLQSLVSDLYGGDGITLAADPQVVAHQAHFTAASTAALNNLSDLISSNVGVLSFNSTVSAISFDIESGVPVRSQESLGPSLAERASTIGKGRLNIAASFASVDFKQLNGQDMDSFSLTLHHVDIPPVVVWENDTITLDLDMRLRERVLALYGTYGITDRLDVGMVVPVIHIDGKVRSVASINTTYCTPETIAGIGCVATTADMGVAVHRFADGFNPIDTNQQSATGIGDVVLRTKWRAFGGPGSRVSGALLGQAQLATGDEADLLGTGSNTVSLFGVASANLGALNPHINLGYEYFLDKVDLRNPAGDDDEDPVATTRIDRSNWRGVVGFDMRARENLAFSTEFLGRWEDDGHRFLDLALGAKWAPNGTVPLNINFVFPINRDEGMRPDYIVSIGIESTF